MFVETVNSCDNETTLFLGFPGESFSQCGEKFLEEKETIILPSRLALRVKPDTSTKTAKTVIDISTFPLIAELFSSRTKHTTELSREKEQSEC